MILIYFSFVVHVLKIVGEKLTKTGWKFTVNPCDVSKSGVWRNLTTLEGSEDIVYAAATELYATSLTCKTYICVIFHV